MKATINSPKQKRLQKSKRVTVSQVAFNDYEAPFVMPNTFLISDNSGQLDVPMNKMKMNVTSKF